MSLVENPTKIIFDNYRNPLKGICPNRKSCDNYTEISYDCNIERNMSLMNNRFPCYKQCTSFDERV